MRCKQCDYSLWNLRSRECPECGRPFIPSEFDFVVNSVRFCCPYCNQDYYGTGERGHLVPAEFNCVGCQRPVRMDEMVLLPTEGVTEDQTLTDTMHWLDDREGHGPRSRPLAAYFTTIFRAMFEPQRLALTLPAEPAIGRAALFAFINAVVPALLSVGVMLGFMFIMLSMSGMPGGAPGMFTGVMIGLLVGSIVAYLIVLVLWMAIAHILLRITGPINGTFGHTAEALCYGTAGNMVSAIPCLGLYLGWIGWIWTGTSATIMVTQRHAVGGLRATIAVFAFPVVLIVLVFFLFFTALFGGVQQARMAAGTAQTAALQMQATGSANMVSAAISAYTRNHDAWPGHAIELIHHNHMAAQAVAAPGRQLDDLPVGGMSLNDFVLLPPERERAFVDALAASLPPETIAHRLGDYIFTWHGLPVPGRNGADPRLWIAMYAPVRGTHPVGPVAPQVDPDMAPPPPEAFFVYIQFDGTTGVLAASRLSEELEAQNSLRQRWNLEPLPDPRDIQHNTPVLPEER